MDQSSTPPPTTTPNWESGARKRVPFYLLTALILAVLAAVLSYSYLEGIRSASVVTGRALVARTEIRPGTKIDESMLELRDVPEAILPAGSLSAFPEAVGRVALVPVAPGEVLLQSKLSGGADGGLSANLPDGRWAMVLPSAWMVSPIPELRIGDRVDILAYQGGQPLEEVGIIVSEIEVLGLEGDQQAPGNLTIAVTLEETKSILYARANGFALLPLLRPSGE